jgi:hypothetical protein
MQQQPLVYRRNVVVAVLFILKETALLPQHSYGKTGAAAVAIDRLLMMGKRIPETY